MDGYGGCKHPGHAAPGITSRCEMVARRKNAGLLSVRGKKISLGDIDALGATGSEMDRRAANSATTSFPPGQARLHRPGISTHVRRVRRGGTPRQITSGDWSVGARFDVLDGPVGWSWTPDGRSIVVEGMNDSTADMNYRNANLYIIDIASRAARRLT